MTTGGGRSETAPAPAHGRAGGEGAGEPVPVLRLVTRLNIGGPAQQALFLARALAPEHPTTLAAGRPEPREGELDDPGVPVERLSLVRPLAPARDARALLEARSLLSRLRPAIVHTHMAKAGSVGRTAALTVRPRPLLVHTFHGHVLAGYFRPAVTRAFLEVERRLARRTDALVAVSPQVRDELLRLGVGTPEQYRVVPLGLDLARFAAATPTGALRERIGVGDTVPLVGAVGRLAPVKNLELLLQAAARLPEVHVALVGDGEERARLEALAAGLGLRERVHLTGWAPDVAAALADLDVVALTSRNEGTPVALIEALAAGKPVVATDVGGVPFVVRDGVSGRLVPPDDPGELAAAIEAALRDGASSAAMAEAGRADVLARFTRERLAEDVRALYRELTG